VKTGDDLKRGMEEVRDAVSRVVHEVAHGEHDGCTINVARRTNIKVARNVGHDGGTARASSTQAAPIVQHGDDHSE
jgi:hypothetical protein